MAIILSLDVMLDAIGGFGFTGESHSVVDASIDAIYKNKLFLPTY